MVMSEDKAAPELLPCKCGWRPVVHGSFDMGYLIAHDCEHVAEFRTSDNERGPVIAAWNRRAAPSAPAEVEGLVTLRERIEALIAGRDIIDADELRDMLAHHGPATALTALQARADKAEAVADQLADALHHMVNASPHPDQSADDDLAAYAKLKGEV